MVRNIAGSQEQQRRDKRDDLRVNPIEVRTTKPPASKFSRRLLNQVVSSSKVSAVESPTIVADLSKDNQTGLINEADVCQNLLIDGYVQSFVDFFHLTHRIDPNSGSDISTARVRTSSRDMIFLRDNLVMAEVSRRQGNTSTVYQSYSKLAEFYANALDWLTSVFFHEKCLEVSQLTADARAEMSANHALGIVYQKMLDFETAKEFHERHEEIAKQYDVPEEIAKSNVELYKVYNVLARKVELSEGDHTAALALYEACLQAAKKSFDKTAESDANGKIGTLLLQRNEASRSIPYLREQCHISQEMGDSEGRCSACSALALAYDMLALPEKALIELNTVKSISELAGDPKLQSRACRALGSLYSKVGKLDEALEAIRTHYRLVHSSIPKDRESGSSQGQNPHSSSSQPRQNESQDEIPRDETESSSSLTTTIQDFDMARAFVGIAKGNSVMSSYLAAIQTDLPALLDWKLTRSAFKFD
jgi:tetratricopeptide (TPR) repeat protein